MFNPGDKVVCIKVFEKGSLLGHTPPQIIPQVGCHYTVIDEVPHPQDDGWYLLHLEETPDWSWLSSYFRKIVPFEEPKVKLIEAPKPKEPEYV